MSSPGSASGAHEHEPDRAALDELLRAFADEPDERPEPPGDLVIVEQDPLPDELPDDELDELPVELDELADEQIDDEQIDDEQIDELLAAHVDESDPSAPRIVRIDDYSGEMASEIAPPDPTLRPPPADISAESDRERIVIDLDDEIPDALYIQGSLESDGKRSIVFIEDDESADAIAPESERDVRRGIEPRLRERRVAVKRAQGRKRLKWVALGAGVFVLIVGVLAVLGSSLFAIRADEVSVTGNTYTDAKRLQKIVDDLVGTPALLVDTGAVERDLEAIPWVEEAKVSVDFPHRAAIEIRERRPIATYQGPDGRYRVLDSDGRVLDVIPGYPFAYVLLGGPDAVDLKPGQFAPAGYAAAADLAKNLTSSVRGRLQRIDVAADGSRLVMYLQDGTEVRFGEARDLFVKLVRLETVLTSGEPPAPDSAPRVIDVSTREVTQ